MPKILGVLGKFVGVLLVIAVLLSLVFFLAQGPIQYSGRGVLSRDASDWHAQLASINLGEYQPWEVEAEGGRSIRGLSTVAQGQMPALLWLHARDQNVTDIGHYLRPLAGQGFHVFAMEYRGYSVSEGETREANLLADAEAAYEALSKRDDVASRRILAGGTEIGAVLALKLSTRKDLAGVVAMSPVPDMETALRTKIPVVPLAFLLRDRYDLMPVLPLVGTPVLILHGTMDPVVSEAKLQEMVAKIGSKSTVIRIEGATRETVPTKATRDVWDAVTEFIQRSGR